MLTGRVGGVQKKNYVGGLESLNERFPLKTIKIMLGMGG